MEKRRISIKCNGCSIILSLTPSKIKNGHKFCSNECKAKYKRSRKAIEARFWKYVVVLKENDCWLWIGSKDRVGYGHFYFNNGKKKVRTQAHRFMWFITHGKIPKDLLVCHDCPTGDNPSCCNPKHLFLGTHKDNTRDMFNKGRKYVLVGEEHPNAKINKDVVLLIFKLSKEGFSHSQIGMKVGISKTQVWRILHGKRWGFLFE